jgi:hypothetical protein
MEISLASMIATAVARKKFLVCAEMKFLFPLSTSSNLSPKPERERENVKSRDSRRRWKYLFRIDFLTPQSCVCAVLAATDEIHSSSDNMAHTAQAHVSLKQIEPHRSRATIRFKVLFTFPIFSQSPKNENSDLCDGKWRN